jgi:enamine deaminase RidA (YjgF/YER057c/UK114 family)
VKQAIEPNPRRTFAGMSQAVRIGNQIHVSGQVAFDEDGNIVGEGDPKLQAQQCFRNIEALLREAGASPADVVKLTCFLVDGASFPAYSEAKGKFLGDSPVPPASTTVIVAGLLVPGLLMEVEALAVTAA